MPPAPHDPLTTRVCAGTPYSCRTCTERQYCLQDVGVVVVMLLRWKALGAGHEQASWPAHGQPCSMLAMHASAWNTATHDCCRQYGCLWGRQIWPPCFITAGCPLFSLPPGCERCGRWCFRRAPCAQRRQAGRSPTAGRRQGETAVLVCTGNGATHGSVGSIRVGAPVQQSEGRAHPSGC